MSKIKFIKGDSVKYRRHVLSPNDNGTCDIPESFTKPEVDKMLGRFKHIVLGNGPAWPRLPYASEFRFESTEDVTIDVPSDYDWSKGQYIIDSDDPRLPNIINTIPEIIEREAGISTNFPGFAIQSSTIPTVTASADGVIGQPNYNNLGKEGAFQCNIMTGDYQGKSYQVRVNDPKDVTVNSLYVCAFFYGFKPDMHDLSKPGTLIGTCIYFKLTIDYLNN